MKRTFQSRISYKHYVLQAVLLLVVVCLYWMPLNRTVTGVLLAVLLTLMTIVTSRAINTCYVVHSEGFLEIRNGRFSKTRHIPLTDIQRIDKIHNGALILVLTDQTELFITPRNESDFIQCIKKYRS